MGKKPEVEAVEEAKTHKKTKYNRFEKFDEPDTVNKNTWPSVIHLWFRMQWSTSAISLTDSMRNNSKLILPSTGKCWQSRWLAPGRPPDQRVMPSSSLSILKSPPSWQIRWTATCWWGKFWCPTQSAPLTKIPSTLELHSNTSSSIGRESLWSSRTVKGLLNRWPNK